MSSYKSTNFSEFIDLKRSEETDQLLKSIQLYMDSWHNQHASGFNSCHSLDTMFPEKDGVEYDKLKLTLEGEYSITRRADGRRLLQKMISIVGPLNKKHVTDLTGNVGGDTILFGLNCKSLVFGLDNVNLHFGDSTKVYNWYTDILYIDPPWGGPDYKEKENLDLFLGDVRLDLFIRDILAQEWRPNYIFLKLPRNYNFRSLENLLNVKQIHKFAIRSFNCIALEVY